MRHSSTIVASWPNNDTGLQQSRTPVPPRAHTLPLFEPNPLYHQTQSPANEKAKPSRGRKLVTFIKKNAVLIVTIIGVVVAIIAL